MNHEARRSVKLVYIHPMSNHSLKCALLVLMSFEVATPTILWILKSHLHANILLPYKAHFGGAKFDRGWGQPLISS